VGTSGWNYASWRKHLYEGIPARRWLEHASHTFGTLEINGSFYKQIAPETFRRWHDETPPGFPFSLKGHRFVTHYKRLNNVEDSIRRVREPALELGPKLHAVLWQLPARDRIDVPRLAGFVEQLATWPEVRHAIELRHRSWFTREVASVLGDAGVAACMSDAPDFPMWRQITTDFVYVRLHGHTRKYASSYSRAHLRRWAADARAWAAQGRDVYIYFDNDAEGAAVENAIALEEALSSGREAPSRRRHV
jgi:uncharacterized protein YecE (DUF72 family)